MAVTTHKGPRHVSAPSRDVHEYTYLIPFVSCRGNTNQDSYPYQSSFSISPPPRASSNHPGPGTHQLRVQCSTIHLFPGNHQFTLIGQAAAQGQCRHPQLQLGWASLTPHPAQRPVQPVCGSLPLATTIWPLCTTTTHHTSSFSVVSDLLCIHRPTI